MNLLLFEDEDLTAEGLVSLSGRRLAHMREVHRVQAGDILRAGRLGAGCGSATILRMDETGALLEYRELRSPPAKKKLTVVLALPRPKVLGRVLQFLAAFGCERIIIMRSWRVEKSYWSSPRLEPQALRHDLLLGLEQGLDTILPVVELRPLFKPFVQDELPALAAGARAVVFHPYCCTQLAGFVHDHSRPLVAVFGPEGGFTEYEIDQLQQAGCTALSFRRTCVTG